VYNGPAFTSLDPMSLSFCDLEYAQNHLVILSGMYGVLHCNSLISPYRLEMGLSVLTYEAKNLYTFWKNRITIYLEMYCKRSELNAIINCASGEYAKTIDFSQLSIPVITCDFREMP